MPDYPIRPVPLGKISPTPGTPVRLTDNNPTWHGNADITLDAWARMIGFKAPSDSGGRIFVGTSAMNKTTFAGVLFVLDAGETFSLDNPQQAQPYRVGDIFVDSDNAAAYVLPFFDPS